jgi:type I restriction enzyme S subunit
MIGDLKPYADYKESGLPWLGRIPAQWELLRSKYIFREVDQRSTTGVETRLSMSQKHGLIPSSRIEEHRLVSESQVGAKICEAGYLVLNRLKAHLGVFALATERGIVSPDYTVFRPTRPMVAKYFEAFYRTPECRIELGQRAKGIVEGFWRLYTDDFYNICVPVPSKDEQAAIVRFLDYANRRLERAIRAKRKVIALLNEQKQAIIHRAVTRGLDPNAPLKPSGIPWLGEIPAHWETISLGAASHLIQTGPFGSQLHSHEYVIGGTPVINPSHMRDGRIFPDRAISAGANKAQELARHKLCDGDIVAARRGELGRCALVTSTEKDWLCGTGSLLIRPKAVIFNPAYLQQVFSSQGIRDSLRLSSIGATMNNLNARMVARLRFPLPSTSEQSRIIEAIEAENNEHQQIVGALHRQIALLREYRTRLIADVVTGKLDVRGVAASLPDETYEPESNLEGEPLEDEAEPLTSDEEVMDE